MIHALLISPATGPWAERHNAAVRRPRASEAGILKACEALRIIVTSYSEDYDDPIGNDGVLGPCWVDMARGVLGLLNGECGRLDCGTVDHYIRNLYSRQGFEGEL